MRTFDHPNMTNFRCPICGTADDKPVVLLPIIGTEDGNICEAKQFHFDCIDLIYDSVIGVVYHKFEEIKQ